MGVCASCLGGNRHESPEVSPVVGCCRSVPCASRSCAGLGRISRTPYLTPLLQPESSRLLDDDPYQAGYGYGALNHAQNPNQPDPEYVRREREALDAICQRTSE